MILTTAAVIQTARGRWHSAYDLRRFSRRLGLVAVGVLALVGAFVITAGG